MERAPTRGGLGALAGWGMTGAAIYDAQFSSPEKISMAMTPVMIIYSSLFCRWAIIVKPQNLVTGGVPRLERRRPVQPNAESGGVQDSSGQG